MGSAIDTATADGAVAPASAQPERAAPAAAGAIGPTAARGGPRVEIGPERARRHWRISPLTRRILAVNVLALALLAGGFLYLGKYQASLVGQQIESLKTQGEIFGAALAEGAVLDSIDEGEVLLPDLARQMMSRLVEPTRTRARLFDGEGNIVADSQVLRSKSRGTPVLRLAPLPPPNAVLGFADRLYDWLARKLLPPAQYPTYAEKAAPRAEDYGEVMQALRGDTGSAVRRDPTTGGLVISVAVPIERFKQVLGAVMLSTGSTDIEQELRNVRFELLRIFGAALFVTVLLSF